MYARNASKCGAVDDEKVAYFCSASCPMHKGAHGDIMPIRVVALNPVAHDRLHGRKDVKQATLRLVPYHGINMLYHFAGPASIGVGPVPRRTQHALHYLSTVGHTNE